MMTVFTIYLIATVWLALAQEYIDPEALDRLFPRIYGPEDFAELPSPQGWTCNVQRFQAVITLLGSRCDSIPINASDFDYVTELSVYATSLKKLKKDSFKTWPNLLSLEIRANSFLTKVENRTFDSLSSLQELSFIENQHLESLPKEAFYGLTDLRSLRILKSNVVRLAKITPALSPEILPSLRTLEISDNIIPGVYDGDFAPMKGSTLENIVMEDTQTMRVDGQAFSVLSKLKSLKLGNNPLNGSEVVNLVKIMGKQLKELSVAASTIAEDMDLVLNIVANSSIQILNISSNVLGSIPINFIPFSPKIESLDLSNTELPSVGSNTLQQLPHLSALYLSRNRLPQVPALYLPTLRILDLSGNSDFLPLGTRFVIEDKVFANLTALESLNLSNNFIEILTERTFENLPQLRYLYLRNSKVHMVDSGLFASNSRLIYLDMSENDFPAIRGLTPDLFLGLDGLQALDLSSCDLDHFTHKSFIHLRSLRFLSLRGNSFLRLQPAALGPALERVDLRYNYISPWTERAFDGCPNLTAVRLRSNHLTTLTPAMVADLGRTQELDLAENALSCDCQLFSAVAPLLSTTAPAQRLFSNYENSCSNGMPITNFWKATVARGQCRTLSLAERAAIAVGVIIILAVIAAAGYRWRWELIYCWIHTRHLVVPVRREGRPKGEGGWQYDAFISFSHRDRRFVGRLVAVLEGRFGAQVCVYDRDFAAGALISEAVLAAVAASRTTVLVISEAFVQSHWCLWEAAISQQRQLFFRRALPDALVVVRLGQLDESALTPTLRLLLSSRIHLEWHPHPVRQRVFWHRLWQAVSRPSQPPYRTKDCNQPDILQKPSPLWQNIMSNSIQESCITSDRT